MKREMGKWKFSARMDKSKIRKRGIFTFHLTGVSPTCCTLAPRHTVISRHGCPSMWRRPGSLSCLARWMLQRNMLQFSTRQLTLLISVQEEGQMKVREPHVACTHQEYPERTSLASTRLLGKQHCKNEN